MHTFLTVSIVFALGSYLVSMLMMLAPAYFGPRAQDRVLAIDFITLNAMLLILVLGLYFRSEVYFEAALLIAFFGFISSAAFSKFLLRGEVIE